MPYPPPPAAPTAAFEGVEGVDDRQLQQDASEAYQLSKSIAMASTFRSEAIELKVHLSESSFFFFFRGRIDL